MKLTSAVVLSLLVLLTLAVDTTRGAERPTLNLTPKRVTGTGSESVSYEGSGYSPGADVTVVGGEAALILARTQAAPDGTIAGDFMAPSTELLPEAAGYKLTVSAIETGSGIQSVGVALEYGQAWHVEAAREDTVRLQFALTLDAVQPDDATYWVLYGPPSGEPTVRRLTDPEGDGTLSFSTEVPAGLPLRASIVSATGARESAKGPIPAHPSTVIKDFGDLTPTEDMLLEPGFPAFEPSPASVSVSTPDRASRQRQDALRRALTARREHAIATLLDDAP